MEVELAGQAGDMLWKGISAMLRNGEFICRQQKTGEDFENEIISVRTKKDLKRSTGQVLYIKA